MKPDLDKAEEQARRDREDGEVVMSMFRCWDMNCNTLLTEEDHALGRCSGCQGRKYKIATYLTEEEDKLIKEGKLHPHKVNLNAPGVEPPAPQEVH